MKRKQTDDSWIKKIKQPDANWIPSTERDHIVAYIQLARQGKLYRFVQLRLKYAKLYAELEAVWAAMIDSNKTSWLDKFAMRMHRQGKNFQTAMEHHIYAIDRRRLTLRSKLDAIRKELRTLSSVVPVPKDSNVAMPETGSMENALKADRSIDAASAYRDFNIRRFKDLPNNEELCKRLDLVLVQRAGEPYIGIPQSWGKYGVKTYSAAYEHPRCKGLVQAVISKAKEAI